MNFFIRDIKLPEGVMPRSFSFRAAREPEIAHLKAGHVSKFSPEDMVNLKPSHMDHINPEAMKGLRPEHMEKIPPETMGGFNAKHFQHTSPEAMTGLKAAQVETIPPEAIFGIKAAHMSLIPQGIRSQFSTEQLQNLDDEVSAILETTDENSNDANNSAEPEETDLVMKRLKT